MRCPLPRCVRHPRLALPHLLVLALAAGCGGSGGPAGPADAGAADAGAGCGGDVVPAPGRVFTDRGAVQGIAAGDGAWAFLGVPFAAPPVGDRRFRPPADVACRDDVVDADALPPRCPQLEVASPGADPVVEGDEDCLYLNAWAPRDAVDDAAASPRPVLFFIHGGGNVQGSAVESVGDRLLYDGAALAAARDVVVVVAQYRLGPLGFLAHPALSAESPDGVSGNLGTRDQLAALDWVRRNAAALGGDPERVLVFGESAGAVNTCVLMATPASRGLFAAALMQSGGCGQPTLAAGEDEGVFWAGEAGCGGAADVPGCLRGLSLDDVLLAVPSTASVIGGGAAPVDWRPRVDGVVLPESPIDAMRAGRSHAVPFVVGSNADETGRDFPPVEDTDEAYRQALRTIYGLGDFGAGRVMDAYPRETFGTARAALVQATTDARFTCGARAAARAQAAGHPGVPVYRYLFAQRLEGGSPLVRAWGAWHGLELLFLFGVLDVGGYTPTAGDLAVADQMQAYWTSLADDGAPDPAGLPTWPTYREPGEVLLRLAGETPEAVPDPRRERCDFWDAFVGG